MVIVQEFRGALGNQTEELSTRVIWKMVPLGMGGLMSGIVKLPVVVIIVALIEKTTLAVALPYVPVCVTVETEVAVS